MKRLPWLFLLGLFLVSCKKEKENEPAALVEPLVLNGTDEIEVASDPNRERDPTVRLSEPSIVYVTQNGMVRFVQYWPHQREETLTVPLRTIDDGSGPLQIGVVRRRDKSRGSPICSECLEAFHTCCMGAPDRLDK